MNPLLIEAAALYWPILTTLILVFVVGVTRFDTLGLLYAVLWNLATLPLFNGVAEALGWWSFQTQSQTLGGLPLSLWLGWAALWGGVCALLTKYLPIGVVVLLAGLVDWKLMPMMSPVLQLNEYWLWGELFFLLAVLLPSLWLFKWTAKRNHLALRSCLISTGFALLALVLVPLAVHQGDWEFLWAKVQRQNSIVIITIGILAVIVSIPPLLAVREFVVVGKGTPVPMDAPSNLVTTGIYRYTRNPMQIGFVSLLLLEAILLSSTGLGVVAVSFFVYSIGFARWSEEADMRRRFGAEWERYRGAVPAWGFRWRRDQAR